MTKIRFGNKHAEGGVTYEQGGVYEVDPATARHFVRVGKAQLVDPRTKTTEDHKATAIEKAGSKPAGDK